MALLCHHIIAYFKKFVELYGCDKCTPNIMHLACHLKDCISAGLYGPLALFWRFEFELYNGTLKGMKKIVE